MFISLCPFILHLLAHENCCSRQYGLVLLLLRRDPVLTSSLSEKKFRFEDLYQNYFRSGICTDENHASQHLVDICPSRGSLWPEVELSPQREQFKEYFGSDLFWFFFASVIFRSVSFLPSGKILALSFIRDCHYPSRINTVRTFEQRRSLYSDKYQRHRHGNVGSCVVFLAQVTFSLSSVSLSHEEAYKAISNSSFDLVVYVVVKFSLLGASPHSAFAANMKRPQQPMLLVTRTNLSCVHHQTKDYFKAFAIQQHTSNVNLQRVFIDLHLKSVPTFLKLKMLSLLDHFLMERAISISSRRGRERSFPSFPLIPPHSSFLERTLLPLFIKKKNSSRTSKLGKVVCLITVLSSCVEVSPEPEDATENVSAKSEVKDLVSKSLGMLTIKTILLLVDENSLRTVSLSSLLGLGCFYNSPNYLSNFIKFVSLSLDYVYFDVLAFKLVVRVCPFTTLYLVTG